MSKKKNSRRQKKKIDDLAPSSDEEEEIAQKQQLKKKQRVESKELHLAQLKMPPSFKNLVSFVKSFWLGDIGQDPPSER